MANWNEPRTTQTGFGSVPRAGGAVVFDEGLRRHMLSIYNYMASGVLLSAVIALVFANSQSLLNSLYQVISTPQGQAIQPTLLGWIVMLAPLGIVLAIRFGGAERFSVGTLKAMFWAYAALFGASISYIVILYTGQSLGATFFAAAGAFAGMSLFGYTTGKNLSALGSFLMMGVIGLIIAMVLNLFFFHSTAFDLAISALGVLIFAGLTAYYTQALKEGYAHVRGTPWEGKQVVLGALTLYIAFINMFLFLLRFMGNSRS
ncbi:Bax inhibitor-1 family protein [Tsuneonella mangrovi]|uniref:Bax inhibitor-1/YccA family protein n=1 Tax=Tsuneonella mangrovi TaxID=1982042 RepID=UPI000BA2725E|nr:Bax inhibitor-1/YccA family protein [Tsuneonella mangrovi]